MRIAIEIFKIMVYFS